ncbi:LytTR family transcriptional regulator DNA-binding domain-containing protein [Bacillus thuringiensis]
MNDISEIEAWFNCSYNLMMKEGWKVGVSGRYGKEVKKVVGI